MIPWWWSTLLAQTKSAWCLYVSRQVGNWLYQCTSVTRTRFVFPGVRVNWFFFLRQVPPLTHMLHGLQHQGQSTSRENIHQTYIMVHKTYNQLFSYKYFSFIANFNFLQIFSCFSRFFSCYEWIFRICMQQTFARLFHQKLYRKLELLALL